MYEVNAETCGISTTIPSTHTPVAQPSTTTPSTHTPDTQPSTTIPSTHTPVAQPSTTIPSTHTPVAQPSTTTPSTHTPDTQLSYDTPLSPVSILRDFDLYNNFYTYDEPAPSQQLDRIEAFLRAFQSEVFSRFGQTRGFCAVTETSVDSTYPTSNQ